ncbi:MAG: type II secretion system protein N [Pseudomonadales bacterium]|nr:type II secretion system protein N [Pseudomonadales bacterium]
MKRNVLVASLASFALLILLALKMPSDFLLYQLAQRSGMLYLDNVQGSLFSGSAQHVQIKFPAGTLKRQSYILELGTVEWRLKPWSLLMSDINLAVSARQADQFVDAAIVYDFLSDKLTVNDSQARLDITWLSQFYRLPAKLAGQIDLDVQALALWLDVIPSSTKLPQIDALEAQLVINDLAVSIQKDAYLGDFGINMRQQDNQLQANLSDIDAAFNLSGMANIELDDQRYEVDLNVQPTAETDTVISQTLNFIARKQSNGDYRLQYSGQLN